MRVKLSLAIFLIFLAFLAFSVSTASVQPTLKIDKKSANAGETVTVNITALNVTDLANFDITVEYNPSVVIVTNAENNPAFGTPINNLEYASEGWVRIASLNLGEGKSGDVLISTLTLKAVGNGGDKSNLNLTVNTFVNSSEGDIQFTVSNGSFTVEIAPVPASTSTEVAEGEGSGEVLPLPSSPEKNTTPSVATTSETIHEKKEEVTTTQIQTPPAEEPHIEETPQITPTHNLTVERTETPGFEVLFAVVSLFIIYIIKRYK